VKFKLAEKVVMELSLSGRAVVVKVNGEEFYTSKRFVHGLLAGDIKRLKLRKKASEKR